LAVQQVIELHPSEFEQYQWGEGAHTGCAALILAEQAHLTQQRPLLMVAQNALVCRASVLKDLDLAFQQDVHRAAPFPFPQEEFSFI